MEDFNKKLLNGIISSLTIIVISLLTLFLLKLINPDSTNTIQRTEIPNIRTDIINEIKFELEKTKPSEFPDFDLIVSPSSTFQNILIAKNLTSNASNPNQIVGRLEKKLYPQGKFKRMYIYIEASVDNGKPLSVYDDVYLTFNLIGGHIHPTDSLKTPPNNISSLLFSAEFLPYGNLGTQVNQTMDVLKMFNESKKMGINMFLSTARTGGEINTFKIYYECEEKDGCKISF